jgi:hypothetical protein
VRQGRGAVSTREGLEWNCSVMVIEEEKQLATVGTGGVPLHKRARDKNGGNTMILAVPLCLRGTPYLTGNYRASG